MITSKFTFTKLSLFPPKLAYISSSLKNLKALHPSPNKTRNPTFPPDKYNQKPNTFPNHQQKSQSPKHRSRKKIFLQLPTPMKISKGTKVEISTDEDGFLGSYFEAKVVEKMGKNKFRVEYATLLSDVVEGEPLREVVEDYNVRPAPPEIRVPWFEVLDKVDVYDGDGWWVGRVSGRDHGSFYTVYFDSTGDDLCYPFSKLRVHQEYDDGHWIHSWSEDTKFV